MEVGHTKFRPDEGFGQLKRYLETQVLISIDGVVNATRESSKSNFGIEFKQEELRDFKIFESLIKKQKGIRDVYGIRIEKFNGKVSAQFQVQPGQGFGERMFLQKGNSNRIS
jgi:hypothetical protein